MLQSLIGSILAAEADIVVADVIADTEDFGSAIEASHADIVIIGDQRPEAAPRYEDTLMRHPRVTLLLMAPSGRDGYMYALCPTITPLSDLSVTTLLAAVRGQLAPGQPGAGE